MGREWNLVWVTIEVAIVFVIAYFVLGFFFDRMLGLIFLAVAALFWVPFSILAPQNMWFSFMPEGAVKFVGRGDGFLKALIQWEGHTFDENWNIVPENAWVQDGEEVKVMFDSTAKKLKIKKKDGKTQEFLGIEAIIEDEERRLLVQKTGGSNELIEGVRKYEEPRHPFKGFRFYGWFPLDDIHVYKFKWTSMTEDGKPKPQTKWLQHMLCKDDNYYHEYRVKDKGNLPLLLRTFLIIRIVNPVKARFAVHNWLEMTINRIEPLLSQYSTKKYYEALRQESQKIGDNLKAIPLYALIIDDLRKRYGVELRAISLEGIDPPADYQATTLKARTAEYDAQATVITAKAESKKRAQETMVLLIQMISEATGEEVTEVQEKIKNNPKVRKQILGFAQDVVTRQISVQGKSLLDIRVGGANGLEKAAIEILAAFKALSRSENESSSSK
jgi:hypothetical protein